MHHYVLCIGQLYWKGISDDVCAIGDQDYIEIRQGLI